MKWTTWLLFLTSMVLLATVGMMVSRQSRRTPAETFHAIELRIASGRFDQEQTLSNLDRVLGEAQTAGDPALAADIRLARGKLLLEIGAFARARTDFQAVLEEHLADGRDARAVEELLIDVDAQAGDYRAGLTRVERILERDPVYAHALALKGELYRRAAERTLAQSKAIVERLLIPEDALRALPLLERSVGVDPADPRRVAIGHELRGFFDPGDEEQVELVLRNCDTASQHLSAAREAFAACVALGFDAKPFASLLELLHRAGRDQEAIDLGQAAMRIPAARRNLEIVWTLVRALGEQERYRAASDLGDQWAAQNLIAPAAFYVDCCRANLPAQRWSSIAHATTQLRETGNAAQTDISNLYYGLALVGQAFEDRSEPTPQSTLDAIQTGRFFLQRFSACKTPEPFPNAFALAWREIARSSRKLGLAADERDALVGALELQPDYDGELWLRLAELQMASPHGGYRLPELRWATGMSLLPLRTAELLPRWKEIGELELKAAGVEIASVLAELVSNKAWSPPNDASPYELFRLAELSLAADDAARAAVYSKRLLELVPGFVPALDIALDASLAQGKRREFVARLLERLRAVGADERNRQLLRGLTQEELEPGEELALMRADPEQVGRLTVARSLTARGEPALALATLEKIGYERLGDEGRLLAAELQLALGGPKAAAKLLQPLATDAHASQHALALIVAAGIASDDCDALTGVVGTLVGNNAPDNATWLPLADTLLAGGCVEAADALLVRLDGDPATRGGDTVLRRAALELTRGDLDQFEHKLERAQAFDTEGVSDFLNVLATSHAERYDDLPHAVELVRASHFAPTPLQAALFDILAERFDAAHEKLAAALAREPGNALWSLAAAGCATLEGAEWSPSAYLGREAQAQTELFLRGPTQASDAGSVQHDARQALCILLALQTPRSIGWARTQLRALSRADFGELWPSFLSAQAKRDNGELSGARADLGHLLTVVADCGPAWDLLAELVPADAARPGRLAELAQRRVRAMGPESLSESERVLYRAGVFEQAGDHAQAFQLVATAVRAEGSTPELQLKFGRQSAARGEYLQAIRAYHKACLALAPEPGRASTQEFLRVLYDASLTQPPAIERADYVAELDALQAYLPDDPRIVVEQARLDLTVDPHNPAFAVSRAYARLERFRELHKRQSLERLAPHAIATWVEFYLRLDPERAEEFLQGELQLDPGTLEAWVLLGRVYSVQHERKAAIEQFEMVMKLAPQSRVIREYARLKVEGELNPGQIPALMKQVLEAEEQSAMDPELALLQGRAFFNLGPRVLPRTLLVLSDAALEEQAKASTSFAQRRGLLYATALVARGEQEDRALAERVLSEILPLSTDPYERVQVQALLGLARDASQLPAQ